MTTERGIAKVNNVLKYGKNKSEYETIQPE